MPSQKTSPSDYPQAVLRQIEQLAQNITIARKRRGESQLQWAQKLGISQPTMVRIERGDPSVAMASYVMCIWLINPSAGLADLIAPVSDHAALEKELDRVRAKAGPNAMPKPKAKTTGKPASAQSRPTAQAPSAEARNASKAGISSASEIAHSMGDVGQSLTSTSTLAELARSAFDPVADLRKSLAEPAALSALARLQSDPMADIRRSLAGTHQGSATAKGLAALMLAKPVAKKND